MISAYEARNKSDNLRKDKIEDFLKRLPQKIENALDEAINSGFYELDFPIPNFGMESFYEIGDKIAKLLSYHDYRVTGHWEQKVIKISWKNLNP